jgi:hypothetical protein
MGATRSFWQNNVNVESKATSPKKKDGKQLT